jgi:hypothetical protein
MAQGAPEGYTSHCAARDHLDQFWAAICTLPEYAALVFHIERSRYKESDAHSQDQAVNGIRSKDGTRLLRAGAGLSLATWKRANAALEKRGFLQRTRHENRHGKYDPTEYKVLWVAIKTAIENCQSIGSERAIPMAQGEPIIGSERAIPMAQGEPIGMNRIPLAQKEPHVSQSQSLDLKSVTVRARAREIAAVVAAATGEEVRSDRLLIEIVEAEEKERLPKVVLERFIHECAYERRAAGRRTNPGFVHKVVQEDFARWTEKFENRNFIERVLREEQREAELAEIERKDIAGKLSEQAKGAGAK